MPDIIPPVARLAVCPPALTGHGTAEHRDDIQRAAVAVDVLAAPRPGPADTRIGGRSLIADRGRGRAVSVAPIAVVLSDGDRGSRNHKEYKRNHSQHGIVPFG